MKIAKFCKRVYEEPFIENEKEKRNKAETFIQGRNFHCTKLLGGMIMA